jgi:hypothetical protein
MHRGEMNMQGETEDKKRAVIKKREEKIHERKTRDRE